MTREKAAGGPLSRVELAKAMREAFVEATNNHESWHNAWLDAADVAMADRAAVIAAHEAGVAAERKRCWAIAYEHRCVRDCHDKGFGTNCDSVIATAIREGGKG